MKYLILILLSFTFTHLYGQQMVKQDSVAVRVFNKGRYYIKKYVLTIDGKKYTFSDILKNKYSDYQKLPFIWTLNEYEITVVRKRFMQYDDWITQLSMPIDKIGEKKITTGNATITIKAKRKSGKLILETSVEE